MFRPNKSSSGPSRSQIQALFSFSALWDPKCLQVLVTGAPALLIYVRATCFDLVGHPQAHQEHRFKR